MSNNAVRTLHSFHFSSQSPASLSSEYDVKLLFINKVLAACKELIAFEFRKPRNDAHYRLSNVSFLHKRMSLGRHLVQVVASLNAGSAENDSQCSGHSTGDIPVAPFVKREIFISCLFSGFLRKESRVCSVSRRNYSLIVAYINGLNFTGHEEEKVLIQKFATKIQN